MVQEWARTLPDGAEVLDLGCGPGVPITAALLDLGMRVSGVDASPRMVAAFRDRFKKAPIECSRVEDSEFFRRRFDGVVAWGLMFLLNPQTQRDLIVKVSAALRPGGRFLFTAPAEPCEWADNLTGEKSVSLGAAAYRHLIRKAGMVVLSEDDDEGENHYYFVQKPDLS